MVKYTLGRDVDAPPERVFNLASDFAGSPERISGIERVEILTDGPVGVGTRFKETRIIFKREATEEMEVTEFEPPHRYRLMAESCGCRYQTDILVKPKPGGGSRIEFEFVPTPLTMTAKVMSFVFRPLMKSMLKLMERDLDDVKRAAEEGSRS